MTAGGAPFVMTEGGVPGGEGIAERVSSAGVVSGKLSGPPQKFFRFLKFLCFAFTVALRSKHD